MQGLLTDDLSVRWRVGWGEMGEFAEVHPCGALEHPAHGGLIGDNVSLRDVKAG